MTNAAAPTNERRRCFTAWYKDLARWDPGYFSELSWSWPSSMMLPLGTVLRRVVNDVQSENLKDVPIIEKITFGGVASVLPIDDRAGYKGRLFWAKPGQFVYSRIRAKQGSFTVVDQTTGQLAVSQEYPVYDVDRKQIDSEFLKLVLRSAAFLRHMAGLSHGGSTKTRMLPNQFEALTIPVPPIPAQRRIVAAVEKARGEVAGLVATADQRETEVGRALLEVLGLKFRPPEVIRPRWFVVQWGNIESWGVRATLRQMEVQDLSTGRFPVLKGFDCFTDIRHGCSLGPADRETTLRILKISAVTRGYLRLSEFKHIRDLPQLRREFAIRRGDLLCCRTNGTLEYVGVPAIVEADVADTIFPDKVIRIRCRDHIVPEYVWLIMKTPHLRTQIEAAARTAVGNYAIGTDDLWRLKLPVPPRQVQQDIVRTASRAQAEADRLRKKAEAIEMAAREQCERMVLGAQQP